MAEEVEEVCGPGGQHGPDRIAYRHGNDDGEVTLGGRRVRVERPRMRTKDGRSEVSLAGCEHFASRDALSRVVLEPDARQRVGAALPACQEPVGDEVESDARSESKSAVSRTFVRRTAEALAELMGRRLDDRPPGGAECWTGSSFRAAAAWSRWGSPPRG